MNEFDIIRRFFSRDVAAADVDIGIGDDGAIVIPDVGRDLVVVVDSLVEGVHYPSELAAADLGFRAVAVNLSDIAAMGARPRWMTLALTLSAADVVWLEGFAAGLFEAADAAGVALVGGDTTRGEQTVVSMQIIGDAEHGQRLSRHGAIPGDVVFVSATVGDAAAGLTLLQSGTTDDADRDHLAERFRRPTARVELGQALAGVASAAIDVSDGLHTDLGRLLEASDAAAVIDIERIPLSDALLNVFPDDALRLGLAGGDDYELCFSIAPNRASEVEAIGAELGVVVTQIGRVAEGAGIRYEGRHCLSDSDLRGFDHFRQRS